MSVLPPDHIEVSYLLEGPGKGAGSVVTAAFGLELNTFGDASMLGSIVDQFIPRFQPLMVNTWRIAGGRSRWNTNNVIVLAEVSRNAVGAIASAGVPNNCAVLARKQTNLGGRQNRGRVYLPGQPEGNVNDEGVMLPGALGNWQTAAAAWLANSNAIVGITGMVILHTAVGVAPTLVQSMSVSDLMATQRRRMR